MCVCVCEWALCNSFDIGQCFTIVFSHGAVLEKRDRTTFEDTPKKTRHYLPFWVAERMGLNVETFPVIQYGGPRLMQQVTNF